MNSEPAVDEPDVSGLIIDDDTPLDILCEKQQRLLTSPLYCSWSGPPTADEEGGREQSRRSFMVLANVGIFSSPDEPPIVPDVMLSLDVSIPEDIQSKRNQSYFMWRFGKPPEVVIEVVSNREDDELGERLRRYSRIRIAYYVVYDPLLELGGPTLRVFEMRGDRYASMGCAWFEGVGLGLVEWDGVFEGVGRPWLRWCTREGVVVPTGAEQAKASDLRAKASDLRAKASDLRAEAAEARAQRLAAQLRALGIDPNGTTEG